MRVQKGTILFKYKEVERWYKNLAQGSVITADVYLRRLSRFCEETKLSPEDIIKMSEKEVTNLLQDYVSEHTDKYAGSYLVSIIKIVRSWLMHNGKEVKRKIKVKGAEQSPTLRQERIPTQEELKRVLRNATLQSRVTCSLMAFSGLRPESIGNYQGEDGLALEDLPEIKLKKRVVDFSNIPTLVIVRPELSKTKRLYFTFMGPEGCNYLKEYLESRLRDGEKLTSKSPIITAKVSKIRPFVSTMNIGDQVRKAIRLSGMKQRPYVLRSYFDTQLMMAESKGLIMRDYRTFMMGHVGDIEHRYTLNKSKLPEKTIEDMRESYGRSLKFLETGPAVLDEDDIAKKLRMQILLLDGFTEEEIVKDGLLELKDEELRDRRREKLFGSRDPVGDAKEAARMDKISILKFEDGPRQKIISIYALEAYINEGFISNGNLLPGEKVLVELPNGHKVM
jgi:hypothetical protein